MKRSKAACAVNAAKRITAALELAAQSDAPLRGDAEGKPRLRERKVMAARLAVSPYNIVTFARGRINTIVGAKAILHNPELMLHRWVRVSKGGT